LGGGGVYFFVGTGGGKDLLISLVIIWGLVSFPFFSVFSFWVPVYVQDRTVKPPRGGGGNTRPPSTGRSDERHAPGCIWQHLWQLCISRD